MFLRKRFTQYVQEAAASFSMLRRRIDELKTNLRATNKRLRELEKQMEAFDKALSKED
jgi:prefoldin subunit 5